MQLKQNLKYKFNIIYFMLHFICLFLVSSLNLHRTSISETNILCLHRIYIHTRADISFLVALCENALKVNSQASQGMCATRGSDVTANLEQNGNGPDRQLFGPHPWAPPRQRR